MANTERMYSRQSSQAIQTPNMDCKPLAFMTLMVLTFWFMLSYMTDSYFLVFLIFTNFILLFVCCVSLSSYTMRRYVSTRRQSPSLVEVSTISGRTSYVLQDFPPPYEEAVTSILEGHVALPTCVICTPRLALKNATQRHETATTACQSQSGHIENGSGSTVQPRTTRGSASDEYSITVDPSELDNVTTDVGSVSSRSSSNGEPPPPYDLVVNGENQVQVHEIQEIRQHKQQRHPKRRPPDPPVHSHSNETVEENNTTANG